MLNKSSAPRMIDPKKPFLFFTLTLILLFGFLTMLAARPLMAQRRGEGPPQADKTLSPYFVVLTDDPQTDALPLKSTRADVKIAGNVAAVKITQVYKNQGKKTLEAIYVFPGSTRAAVHAMRMTVGSRVVEAQIMERQKARETYEQAKKEGKTTSLLEQQRPNVFQMNVANILPGDEVKVELNYVELLQAEENIYEFVFPTVVAPRYSNMAAEGAPDTEKWVKSPYLHEGQAPPYTFGLAVDVASALPLDKLASPSHDVDIKFTSPTAAQVRLKDEKTGGNKDFVLRYTLAGDKIETGLLLYPGKDENFFLMMMEPPARVAAEAVVPREYIFIVDVSGSMNGFPLDTSKALIKDIVGGLRPTDFFNVLLFESGNAVLSEAGSLPATDANKQRALEILKGAQGGGGTEILTAFKRALNLPRTAGTSRIVVVATDGEVHVEPQTFELIRENLGAANLFAFGIGTSVNRYIIEGMARAGQGEPFIVLNPGEAPKQAARFRRYIANPVLNNIKVSFEGFDAYDVEPEALPDLFALRPIALLGKYRGNPAGKILVTGKTAQGDFRQEIKLADGKASPDNAALRLLWARQRLQRLSDFARLQGGENPQVKEITALGLKYSLMTAYTSFVAVDKIKRADGTMETVKQPLPLPEGVSDLAVGGRPPYAMPSMMPGAGHGRMKAKVGRGGGGGYLAMAPEKGKVPPGPAPAALSLTILDLKTEGKLDKAAVQKAIEAELAKLSQCFEEAKARGIKLPKEIRLSFAIGADGRMVGQKLLASPAGDAALVKCLSQAVGAIQFPAPGKGKARIMVKLALATK